MSILFVNGSPNARGNTARLAAELLAGREYETLNLAEYKVYEYGKRLAFVFQGEGPAGWMFDAADYTVKRYASLYGMEYLGMVSDAVGARALSKRL